MRGYTHIHREGSSGVQSQESQELTVAADAIGLIVQNSSETHCVNVTNEDMGNRYLRSFHLVSHFMTHITTWSLTYMSVQTSKRAELRGYMWGCVRSTETQRIRTATKFAGPSAGHSERAIRSSVTKAVPLIVVQPSRIALTIGADTLCLSITAEKTTVVPGGMVLPAAVHLYQPPCWFSNFCWVLDDWGVVIVQLWFVMKVLLRCVPDPVFCVHFRVCDTKFGSQTNRPFWSQIPDTMSHVTNGSFLWHRLFCTMWPFVTRTRYKNNVHVSVFFKNKSG